MLLHEAPSLRVDVVSWSPRGDWVAMSQFAAPQDWATWDGVGEMWLLRPQGDERISLGPTVATLVAWHATAPQWSRTGDRLAYLAGSQVLTDEGSAFDASLMIWEEKTGEVRTLLPRSGQTLRALSWAPDDVALLYLATPLRAGGEFAVSRLSFATVQAHEVVPARGLPIRLGTHSTVLWLTSEEVQ